VEACKSEKISEAAKWTIEEKEKVIIPKE